MGKHESGFTLHELCRFRPDSPGYMEKLVSYLATAVQNGDCLFVSTFLGIYPRYATTWQVLDLILKRYGPFQPDNEEEQQTKNAICFFLGLWMEKLPGDFCESPDMAGLKNLIDYVRINMPSSDLTFHIQELLALLEDQECKKAKPKDEEAWDLGPSWEAAPELPAQYAYGMPETLDPRQVSLVTSQLELIAQEAPVVLDPRAVSAVVPQGKPEPHEDPVVTEFRAPSVSVTEPTHLLTAVYLEQDLSIFDTQPSPDMAANVPTTRQVFLATVSQLGDQDPVSPLPDVDI